MTAAPFVPTQEPFFNNGSLLVFTLDAVLSDGKPAQEIEYRGVKYSYVTHNAATKDVTYRQVVT